MKRNQHQSTRILPDRRAVCQVSKRADFIAGKDKARNFAAAADSPDSIRLRFQAAVVDHVVEIFEIDMNRITRYSARRVVPIIRYVFWSKQVITQLFRENRGIVNEIRHLNLKRKYYLEIAPVHLVPRREGSCVAS